jgi:dienelactone hydrolase
MKRACVAAGAALVLFSASQLHADDLFLYDAKADLGLKTVGTEMRGDVAVQDIRFTAVPGSTDETRAYLVIPKGEGPFAGALWVHWLGEPATTNRSEFLEEAVALAGRGLASLLVEAMWSAPKWYENRNPDQDYDNSIQQVVALRRAMDLLVSQPQVDRARLGFVGHDHGAMYGMLAAAADQRARTYVFVAATQSLEDWAFLAKQPVSKPEYLCKNSVFELTDALMRVKNASTLFQNGTKDTYVSRASTAVLLAAAGSPKERKLYETEHAMATPEVKTDRDLWLVRELKLK